MFCFKWHSRIAAQCHVKWAGQFGTTCHTPEEEESQFSLKRVIVSELCWAIRQAHKVRRGKKDVWESQISARGNLLK